MLLPGNSSLPIRILLCFLYLTGILFVAVLMLEAMR
jgi:hypothetical protein